MYDRLWRQIECRHGPAGWDGALVLYLCRCCRDWVQPNNGRTACPASGRPRIRLRRRVTQHRAQRARRPTDPRRRLLLSGSVRSRLRSQRRLPHRHSRPLAAALALLRGRGSSPPSLLQSRRGRAYQARISLQCCPRAHSTPAFDPFLRRGSWLTIGMDESRSNVRIQRPRLELTWLLHRTP